MRSRLGGLLAVAAMGAAWAAAPQKPLVAVVFASRAARSAQGGDGRAVRTYTDTVVAALDSAGVPSARVDDTAVDAGGLKGYRAALFPYNTMWPDRLIEAVEAYVKGGGKVLFFYTAHERLLALVGVRSQGWAGNKRRNEFATIHCRQEVAQGLPASVRQDSWNIQRVLPEAGDALVVGEWRDPDGLPLGEPAVVLSPRGTFMGHVVTGGDVANKGRLLRALVGRLVPEVWERASGRAVAAAPCVGRLKTLEDLWARVEAAGVSASRRRQARRHLAEARTSLDAAAERVDAGRHAEAIEGAAEARLHVTEAFVLTSPERRREFRGTWIHTAYGVKDWGWRASIRHLRDCGFNAIVPNMLWAGLAHYPSKLLPVSPKVAEQGDQMAECLRWCRRYGVELHVWKVNYNLSTAPKAFVEQLRAEGRLGRHRDGTQLTWLCPSDPRNFELERDSMLEVVRNYAVDGIHFDYIRYPHSGACFCEGCRQRFQEAAGVRVEKWPDDVLRDPLKPVFAKWRQEQITSLVRAVSAEARRIRPGVMVSAAVFGDWSGARYSVGQDWRLWVAEGLLDFVCPMDYTPKADYLESLVRRQAEWVNGGTPLYAGIGAWRIRDQAGLADQLERARRMGADGFVCFHYNDLEFTDYRMPALRRSHTAHRTRPPHRAPVVEFDFPPGLEGAEGLAYAEGTAVTVLASVERRGNFRRTPKSASGRLIVETTDGERVARLGRVRSRDRRAASATLMLPPGRYRLAVDGSAWFGWLSWRSFLVRSRPFEVVSQEAAAVEQAKQKPPLFSGRGTRVGVATGGYGSEAILAALRRTPGFDAMPLHRLTPEFLAACQVVVLAQPRDAQATTPATADALRRFVAAGGGLLATHDAVGFRTHPALLPKVCRGADRLEGTTWRPTADHPLTSGLALARSVPHGYYDCIALAPGPHGQPVADGVGADGKAAAPTVVCGTSGKGRYVACGLALGIGRADQEQEPAGPELRLLLNTMAWLAAAGQ